MEESRKFDYYIVAEIIIGITVNVWLAIARPTFFYIAGDTSGYQITSLSELSTIHRTPGLQLISLIFYKIFGSNYEIADYGIVSFQCLLLIVGLLFLYLAIKEYLGIKILSFIVTTLASLVIYIFGFGHALLTEPYAIAAMCFQVWCIIKTVKEEESKYIIWSIVIGMLCAIIRPSHLLLLGIIGGFIIIYGFANHHWIFRSGLISIILCVGIIFGYCGYNRIHHNYFGVSDVKPFNDMATILYAETYDNPKYPEITIFVNNLIPEDIDNWTKAKTIIKEFGFDESLAYISSCKRQNSKEYYQYIINDLRLISQNIVVFDSLESYNSIRLAVDMIRKICLPFTFGGLWILTGACFIGAIVVSIIKRKMLWIEIGICICILSIDVASRVSCHDASLVRTGVHALPCVFFIYAIYFKAIAQSGKWVIHIVREKLCQIGA